LIIAFTAVFAGIASFLFKIIGILKNDEDVELSGLNNCAMTFKGYRIAVDNPSNSGDVPIGGDHSSGSEHSDDRINNPRTSAPVDTNAPLMQDDDSPDEDPKGEREGSSQPSGPGSEEQFI
jgi:hypothetical protein